jgi:hypothetical protein
MTVMNSTRIINDDDYMLQDLLYRFGSHGC